MKLCLDCGASLEDRHHHAKRCLSCAHERELVRQRRVKHRWHRSGGAEKKKAYEARPEIRLQRRERARARYRQDETVRSKALAYAARPDVKARKKARAAAAWKEEKARNQKLRERLARPVGDDNWRPFTVPDYLKSTKPSP